MAELATIKVPSRLAVLFKSDELPRWALEAILVETNRLHKASTGFLREVLDIGIDECDVLLASRGVFDEITPEELERQVEAVGRAYAAILRKAKNRP